MDMKKFRIYYMIIIATMGAVLGWSAATGKIAIPIIAWSIGIILLYVLKNKVEGVIEDERTFRISEKASRRAVQVVGVTTAMIGLILIAASKGGYLNLFDVGYSLTIFATVLLVVYMDFYGYYNKKHGYGE